MIPLSNIQNRQVYKDRQQISSCLDRAGQAVKEEEDGRTEGSYLAGMELLFGEIKIV